MNVTQGGTPPQSLQLQLQVTRGINQIQRVVGNYSALYLADGANMQSANIELTPGNTWTSNPQETYQKLVVSTSGILTFQGVKANGDAIELQVNRMLVIDSEIRSFTLTNSNIDLVRASLNYVSTQQ